MNEGYVYCSYGDLRYLKHVMASIATLRRFDKKRPVALVCSPEHHDEICRHGLDSWFATIRHLPEAHRSITGFKHHVDLYQCFERTLFLDSDMVWCRSPDRLWRMLQGYGYTVTGVWSADHYFGASKSVGIIFDILWQRRRRTLRHFGLSYLPRIQSGMIYASDRTVTEDVCQMARKCLAQRSQTHFQTRLRERGRSLESCEWSLAMAMAKLSIAVFPWMNGTESPQLDYIAGWTRHDRDFHRVECRYYCRPAAYSLRGMPFRPLRSGIMLLMSLWPGADDWVPVTPYTIHFGWLHEKKPFLEFSERVWRRLTVQNRA